MKRCFQCNGRFGLIRYSHALKQFCSKRCVNKYKADTERKNSRIKEWRDFLAKKADTDMFARNTTADRLSGLDALDWSMLLLGLALACVLVVLI